MGPILCIHSSPIGNSVSNQPRNARLLPTVAAPFAFPPIHSQGFPSLYSLTSIVIFHLGEKSQAWDCKGRGEAGAMGGGQSLACVPLCLRSVQDKCELWSPKHPVSVPARGLTAVLLWTNTLHPLSCIPSTAGMEPVPSVTSCWRQGSESTTGTAENFHKLYVATHRWWEGRVVSTSLDMSFMITYGND